jgi:hypothetical protein
VVGLLRADEPEDHRRFCSSSRAKKAAAFFQDVPLLLEQAHPATQLPDLLPLLGGEAVPSTLVDVGLVDPPAERLG